MSTPAVFVAIQKGICRHRIIGVFTNVHAAEVAGVRAIEEEYDHDVEVVEMALDQPNPESLLCCFLRWDGKKVVRK